MSMTIFACQRGTDRKPCVECGARASVSCSYALGGRLEGKICDRALCDRCASPLALDGHCGPHARLRDRRAAEADAETRS